MGPNKPPEWDQEDSSKKQYWWQSSKQRRPRFRKCRKSTSGVAFDTEGPSVGQRKRSCRLLRSSSSSHPPTSGMGLLQLLQQTTEPLLLPPPSSQPPAKPQWLPLPPCLQKPMAGLRSDAVPTGMSSQSPYKDARKRSSWDRLSGSMGQEPAKQSCLMCTSKVDISVASFPDVSMQSLDRRIPKKKVCIQWGDGLAKYEKQKVLGSLTSPVVGTKSEPGKVQGSQDSLVIGTKSGPCNAVGFVGPEECAFTMSVFSHKSSSSQGINCISSSSHEATLGDSAILGVDPKHNGGAARLDGSKVKSVCASKPFLSDLLQPKGTYSGRSISATHLSFKEILHLKTDISMELEQIECEVDRVERELKSLNAGAKSALILSTTDYVVKEVFASSLPMDHIQSADNDVTTTEVLEVISRLLSESKNKFYGSSSRMPAMTLLKKENKSSTFDHKNGLIEDPLSFEVERARIRPWSQQEKEVFVEMFVTFGKDFAKISSFLSHKTTADCIEYYYKNHRTESFIEAKKWFSYLVTSKRKRVCKKSAAALYIMDGSTVASAEKHKSTAIGQSSIDCFSKKSYHDREPPRESKSGSLCPINSSDSNFDRSELDTNDWSENEKSKFVQAMSIHGKNFTMILRYLGTKSIKECKIYFSKAQHVLNLDMIAMESELGRADWTDREKSKFVQALSIYGKNFTMISRYLGTRSIEECITFFAKTRGAIVPCMIHMGTDDTTVASDENYFDTDMDSTFAAIRPGLR